MPGVSSPGDGGRRSVFSRWRSILVIGLLGLAIGFGWGVADQPRYRATAGVAVESDSQGSDRSRLERFAQRGESEEVATEAAGLLGDDVPGADLLSDVVVKPSPKGGAVIVAATSESPDYATAAANGYAEALVEVEGDPLALGAAAQIPSAPIEERSAGLYAAIGLLLGLLIGLVVALAMTLAGRRAGPGRAASGHRDEHPDEAFPGADPAVDLADRLGVPLLGYLPEADARMLRAASGTIDLPSDQLDDLRGIVSALDLGRGTSPGSVGVLALGAGDLGAYVAIGLTTAAADETQSAILVDADLSRPALAGWLGVAPGPGLAEYLNGDAAPRDVLRTVRAEVAAAETPAGFACVPAGLPRPGASIRNDRFRGLVGRLSRAYDVAVYTSAQPLDGGEAGFLAGLVDAVVVVVGSAVADEDVVRAGDVLSAFEVAGVVSCEP